MVLCLMLKLISLGGNTSFSHDRHESVQRSGGTDNTKGESFTIWRLEVCEGEL